MNIENQPNKTFFSFSKPMCCISSAIFGGGIKNNVRTIANITVPTDLNVPVELMPDYCRKNLRLFGYKPKKSVVLLTAVPQIYLGHSKCHRCFVTAGLGNVRPLIPDDKYREVWDEKAGKFTHYSPGTINCIICLDDSLCPSALVEGYGIAKMTIAEIVKDWCQQNHKSPCVGTQTDCTALLCPMTGPQLKFASLGTRMGTDISVMVREATINTISHKYPSFLSPFG
jgi:adenosylcobinamide amidohydrolase